MKSTMKMEPKIILAKQIDYVFEGWRLLRTLTEEKNADTYFMKVKSILKKKYGVESTYTNEYLKIMHQIAEQADSALNQDRERIQYLFGNKYGYTAFELVACFYQNDYNAASHKSAEETYDYFKGLTERERDVFFFKTLTQDMSEEEFDTYMGNDEKGIAVSDAERMKNIFSYIQKMNLSMENRSFIQDCYLQRDSYAQEMMKFLRVAISVIEQHQKELMRFVKEWENYWIQIIEAGRFSSIWNQCVKDAVLKEEKIVVLPSFIQCGAVWIDIGSTALPRDKEQLLVCRMGLIVLDDFNMQSKVKEDYQLEDYQNKLKLLADKSKFDILMYIKDKPAYGSEIAKHFGLTTATVSHHMSRLLEEQLIIVEQQNRKIYYRSNKTVLQKLFEECNRYLTE